MILTKQQMLKAQNLLLEYDIDRDDAIEIINKIADIFLSDRNVIFNIQPKDLIKYDNKSLFEKIKNF